MRKLPIILLILIVTSLYAQVGGLVPYPATNFSNDTAYRVPTGN